MSTTRDTIDLHDGRVASHASGQRSAGQRRRNAARRYATGRSGRAVRPSGGSSHSHTNAADSGVQRHAARAGTPAAVPKLDLGAKTRRPGGQAKRAAPASSASTHESGQGNGTAEADAAAGGNGSSLLSEAKRKELMQGYVEYYKRRQQQLQAMFLMSEMVSHCCTPAVRTRGRGCLTHSRLCHTGGT